MTLFGPDGSRWQVGMKFGTTPHFLKWRASRATTADGTFARSYEWAKANKIPFGAYHFPYPTRMYPAAAQAATFASVCKDKTIPVALDWEQDGTMRATIDDVNAVAGAIRKLGYRVPTLYTGSGYWATIGRPNLTGLGFDLWRARYGDQEPTDKFLAKPRYTSMGGDTGSGWEPLGGLTPALWQFSSRVWWGDRYMDHSAIRRPASDLKNWFQTWAAPPLDPSKMTTPVGTPLMQAGDTDATTVVPGVANEGRVSWLQAVTGASVTGVYDDELVRVITAFQANWNLDTSHDPIVVDGKYGPQTEAALRSYRGK